MPNKILNEMDIYMMKLKELIESETVILISGASAAGKTVCSKMMIDVFDFYLKVITDTSRFPRPGEINGVDYHFREKDEMEIRIEQGKYLEYNIYAGNYYGSSIEAIQDIWNSGHLPIIVIDMNGALAIKRRFPNSKIIFLERDKDILVKEITDRDCSEEERQKRILRLDCDIETSAQADIIIRNEVIDDTVKMMNQAIFMI